ncbi:MAG TPA: F0F1 ATP synthase subunit A, partial [Candidatus Hydrogenedentes bacterium]|nr:F0F1 ATP synthase subunit A [Candidatus Hydrogenedentota bacterium]
MQLSEISPDEVIYWQWGFVTLNATIVFTWALMAFMVIGSWLVTRRLSTTARISRGQNLLEIIVHYTRSQIEEIAHESPERYLPFIGTLFLLVALANVLTVVPGFLAPTGSLSTTAALAVC